MISRFNTINAGSTKIWYLKTMKSNSCQIRNKIKYRMAILHLYFERTTINT
ncbi:MAG: hypothetical protein IPO68_13470 [Chitinophagaceae bacterium]|nr:hypothetical protein [Chitinophagaceae bacterium]